MRRELQLTEMRFDVFNLLRASGLVKTVNELCVSIIRYVGCHMNIPSRRLQDLESQLPSRLVYTVRQQSRSLQEMITRAPNLRYSSGSKYYLLWMMMKIVGMSRAMEAPGNLLSIGLRSRVKQARSFWVTFIHGLGGDWQERICFNLCTFSHVQSYIFDFLNRDSKVVCMWQTDFLTLIFFSHHVH